MYKLLAFLGALALLVCNTTAGLASGLAGGLALAATAILCTLTQITGLDGLNMLHKFTFHFFIFPVYCIISLRSCQSHNANFPIFFF